MDAKASGLMWSLWFSTETDSLLYKGGSVLRSSESASSAPADPFQPPWPRKGMGLCIPTSFINKPHSAHRDYNKDTVDALRDWGFINHGSYIGIPMCLGILRLARLSKRPGDEERRLLPKVT